MSQTSTEIRRYDSLLYDDFLREHLQLNEPLILTSQWTDHWWARQTFACKPHVDAPHGSPSYEGLRSYREMIVPVAYISEREYSEFRREEMALRDVLDLWESRSEEGTGMYVKDWQLSKELVKRGLESSDRAFEAPEIFRDDWMTPRLRDTTSTEPDDFRFTYLGPEGTYTPLHADVYNSYSWSTNLCGRKKWWLFRPGTQPSDVFDVREVGEDVRGKAIEVEQMPGETIFVPSGWWHQVVNLDFCISVNQNWFNSITLPSVYAHLTRNQERVEESIQDVREMLQLQYPPEQWEFEWTRAVQELLMRDAGWNWSGFWECVADNLERPPAPQELSPPSAMTLEIVRKLVADFAERPEMALMQGIGQTILRVSAFL